VNRFGPSYPSGSMRMRNLTGPMVAILAVSLGAVTEARGDGPAGPLIKPGPQAQPPGPVAPTPYTTLAPNEASRRVVRGCPLDHECRVDREGLREFEREAFPAPGAATPWIDGADGLGHASFLRTTGRWSAGADPRRARPDLPWLADLELPDLAVRWDDRVIRYLEFYRNDPRGRALMAHWLRNQGRFKKLILSQLRDHQLPEALLYVAMIESSYQTDEVSRAGASGLWQFMPGTARVYGLRIDRWVDERNDPLRSTAAAMLMFADLYERYRDWNLALAAYNAGYGAVTSSVVKYNTNDFWQLLEYEAGLPWGSQIYVPKALATAIVGHNRKLFGFDSVKPAAPYEFDTVTVPTSVSFDVLARAAGTDRQSIAGLNPHLLRGRTPPGTEGYVVRIPSGRRELFAARFPQLRGEWDQYDAYVSKHGERFEDIATVHGLTPTALAELNGLVSEADVSGGMVLVVPKVSEDDKQRNRKQSEDDLYRSGIPPGQPGDPLIVAVPQKDYQVPGKTRHFYRVVAGDSLYQIAKQFGVDWKELATQNGLNPEAHLHARMVLQVWADSELNPQARGIKVLDPTRIHLVEAGSVEHIELSEGRLGRRRTVYTVKNGGTYEDIGKLYGLSKYDLARINRRSPNTELRKGDEVIVYEVVDKSRSERAARQAQQMQRSRQPRAAPSRRKRR
jgi:membrane-bound lytic murein transglycosylase D